MELIEGCEPSFKRKKRIMKFLDALQGDSRAATLLLMSLKKPYKSSVLSLSPGNS